MKRKKKETSKKETKEKKKNENKINDIIKVEPIHSSKPTYNCISYSYTHYPASYDTTKFTDKI